MWTCCVQFIQTLTRTKGCHIPHTWRYINPFFCWVQSVRSLWDFVFGARCAVKKASWLFISCLLMVTADSVQAKGSRWGVCSRHFHQHSLLYVCFSPRICYSRQKIEKLFIFFVRYNKWCWRCRWCALYFYNLSVYKEDFPNYTKRQDWYFLSFCW